MRPTLSTIRASLPTATYDTIAREWAITERRLSAAARLSAYQRAQGIDGLREFFLGDIPGFRAASVSSKAACDAEVYSL